MTSLAVFGRFLLFLAAGCFIFAAVVKALEVFKQIDKILSELELIYQRVSEPRPTNIIHLGLKNAKVDVGLKDVKLSIRPEDFQVRADKLYAKLLDGLATRTHPSTGTLAYCILDHAGIYDIMDSGSIQEVKKALTRLLNNGDEEAIKHFLETLADSVAKQTAL